MRLPRRTVRLRLTLLYGGLFLLSGAALLVITYLLVANRLPVIEKGSTSESRELMRICAVPSGTFTSPSQAHQCTQLATSIARHQRTVALRQLLIESGVALALMTIVSLALGWLVAGRVLRPLRTITTTTRRITARNLHRRLDLRGPDDELKELGDTVDDLLARLDASFTAQRQFVANASHELRTPLARQRTVMEVALTDPARTTGSLETACERALRAGEQQERLIEALLTLARSERGLDRREPVDLGATTNEVITELAGYHRRTDIDLRFRLDPAAVLGDQHLTERLVANLVDNALRHNRPGGHIEIITDIIAGRPTLRVTHSGPVILPAEVERLLQPFQRLAGNRRVHGDGLGLGLPIAAAIATAHGADLDAHPLPTGGLKTEVSFPALTTSPSGCQRSTSDIL